MKKYMIEVVPKFEKNPTKEEFENICDSIVDAVDNYCNNQERSFHVTFPLQKNIDEGRFTYLIHILIKSEKELRSAALFELLNIVDKHPLVMVTVQESRFCKKDAPIYWYHEGETTYWDGGTYISPNYDLYVNGSTYYTVQYVPVAIKNMSERDKKRYNDINYMWRSTGSWDNFMKAKTLDEAINEFEAIYHNKLLRAVEGNRNALIKAEHAFVDFVHYQMRKERDIE